MNNSTKKGRLVRATLSIAVACLILGTCGYLLFGRQLIESMYKGESVPFLNRMIERHRMEHPDRRTLEFYFRVGDLIFSRVFVGFLALQVVVIGGLKFRQLQRLLTDFFGATTHPVNLAVFRIVLFYAIFQSVDVSYVVWFSQVPRELQVPPWGLNWLIHYIPITPAWAEAASVLLLVFSFLATIGFFTRISALLSVVFGCYVLGIPQLYGKVNHYHHLIWFGAILAASRCGDALSCDAILAACIPADRGVTDTPVPSTAYALPLRFIWVLMGVLYFFAGFWKLWESGFDWALSDNFKFILYHKWTELNGWTPLFRIDRYPLLYRGAALGAIGFEMSFVFLIFSRRFRLLAPAAGLVFHTMTGLFMRIYFTSLVKCYVAFPDWNGLFRRAGRFLFKKEMQVIYDGNCKLCRRTIATFRVLDIFGRVGFVNGLDEKAIRESGLSWLDSQAVMANMHVVVQDKILTGFGAYRSLAARIPFFWPLLPLLYLWPIPIIGDHIYRKVADSRMCSLSPSPTPTAPARETTLQPVSFAVIATGTLLIVASIVLGAANIHFAWPLAGYPSFAGIEGSKIDLPKISVVSSNGEVIQMNERSLNPRLEKERYWGLMGQVLSAENSLQCRIRLEALWRLWEENEPWVKQVDSIRFHRVTLLTIPERHRENPVQEILLFEAKIKDLQAIAANH